MFSLYDSAYLQSLCRKYHLSPSKQYGQNYLVDLAVIERIIETAALSSHHTAVEVGPGFGVLTLALAEKAERVVAFEIERKLQPYWQELQKKYPNVEIVWGNILKEFSVPSLQLSQNYTVVANLPYQITSPVIRLFLEADQPPQEMVLMVQKEVAERICAMPGDMSVLSVAVQYYAEAEMVLVVPRTSFWPEPKVDSAVLRIRVKREGERDEEFEKRFFQIVKAGFANRRKLLIKNLDFLAPKNGRGELKALFSTIGLNEKSRAQELSIEQWKQITQSLKQ